MTFFYLCYSKSYTDSIYTNQQEMNAGSACWLLAFKLVKPPNWPDDDNKVRHSLSWIMVQLKYRATGKWIQKASCVITACCRKISGIYQQPHFHNLFWQWGKRIYWGDTATKWLDFIDWLILNLISYVGSRRFMSRLRVKQTRSIWWVCIKGFCCCASLLWGNSWTDLAVNMERSFAFWRCGCTLIHVETWTNKCYKRQKQF